MSINIKPIKTLGRKEFILLMSALMALNSLAMDIMLPALPDIGNAFNMFVKNDRSLLLTYFSVGFGLTQILFGAVGDRFGRRIPLFVGLIIYTATAFGGVFAPTFEALLFLRLLQGMAAAGVRVMIMAIVRDCYAGAAMAQIMSLVIMVFMLMPVLAPSMGQAIMLIGTWQLIFAFMGGLALLLIAWTFLRLPETLPHSKRRGLTFANFSQAIVIIFSNRLAMGYTLSGMFMYGTVLGFVNTSQQVFVGIYNLGVLFPIVFGLSAIIQSFAGFLNSRFVVKYGMRAIAHFAILAFVMCSLTFWAFSLMGQINIWLYMGFISAILFALTWIMSNSSALAMESLGDVAGTASGVFGTFHALGGAFFGYLINQAFNDSITPLAGGMALIGLASITCILFAEKGKLFRSSKPLQ